MYIFWERCYIRGSFSNFLIAWNDTALLSISAQGGRGRFCLRTIDLWSDLTGWLEQSKREFSTRSDKFFLDNNCEYIPWPCFSCFKWPSKGRNGGNLLKSQPVFFLEKTSDDWNPTSTQDVMCERWETGIIIGIYPEYTDQCNIWWIFLRDFCRILSCC